MKKLHAWVIVLGFASGSALAADPNIGSPRFREVYDLIRSNLTGLSEAQIDEAAAAGLIAHLAPRVAIVPPTTSDGRTSAATGPVLAASVFDEAIAYLRVTHVAPRLSNDLATALSQLGASNQLKGVILDLRYAGGTDYGAALAAAEWFVPSEQPMIDWGQGVRKSSAKEDTLRLPLAILINQQTAAAAEALAGMLRQADIGLLLGTNSSGQASITREFPLSTGQSLRVSTLPIRLGDGQPIPATGLRPDVVIDVDPRDERAFYANSYHSGSRNSLAQATATNAAASGTNRISRRRVNEAELVRMMREGRREEDSTTPAGTGRDADAVVPVITDPALARAIDLLKGLAVVRKFRGL